MYQTPLPLKQPLLASVFATALIVGGCSGGDKSPAAEISVSTESLGLDRSDERALARHFEVAPRAGSQTEAIRVLSELGIGQMEGWVIDGRNAQIADWNAQDGETSVTAASVALTGLYMDGNAPRYDALNVTDMRVTATEDGAEAIEATLAELMIVDPSAELAVNMADVLRGADGQDDDVLGADVLGSVEDVEDFRALRLGTLKVRAYEGEDAGTLDIGQIIIGNDREAETLDAVIEDVNFDWIDNGAPNSFDLVMDGVSVIGLDTRENDSGQPAWLSGLASVSGPSARMPYQQVNMGTLRIDHAMADVFLQGMEAASETKGKVTTLRSVLQPLTVTFKDDPMSPAAPYLDTMRENGLDEVVIKGSQTASYDTGADVYAVKAQQLEIDGGLRLNCDYTLGGLQASQRFLEENSVGVPDMSKFNPNGMTSEEIDEVIEKMGAQQKVAAEAQGMVTINALDCTVQDVADNSLVDRGYKVAASVTGKPVAVLKGGARTMVALSSLTASTAFERDVMDQIGSKVISFIDKPGQTLRVALAPSEPVPMSTFMGGAGEPDLSVLGLSVEVK